jgi:NAD(P)-dependent dehydrogenase (short-subunit alcohol dehydrogenase family)
VLRSLAERHQEDQGKAAERVALITGAGGGLAAAVVTLLAEAGAYRLALVGNRREAVARTATEEARGAEAATLVFDLGDADHTERVVPWAIETFGRVDALINAAAILHRRPFDEVTPRDFDDVFHINALGPFLLAPAAMPDMASPGWGAS